MKTRPRGGAAGLDKASFPGGIDGQPNTPPRQFWQDKSRAPTEITCASRRMAELRDCLARQITCAMANALQAQACLYDGYDEEGLAWLRRYWQVMRADVAPLAAELQDLAGGPPQ
jgi:hypothetical protein